MWKFNLTKKEDRLSLFLQKVVAIFIIDKNVLDTFSHLGTTADSFTGKMMLEAIQIIFDTLCRVLLEAHFLKFRKYYSYLNSRLCFRRYLFACSFQTSKLFSSKIHWLIIIVKSRQSHWEGARGWKSTKLVSSFAWMAPIQSGTDKY